MSAILANLADMEWQIVKQEFLDAVARGDVRFKVQPIRASVSKRHPSQETADEPAEQGKG